MQPPLKWIIETLAFSPYPFLLLTLIMLIWPKSKKPGANTKTHKGLLILWILLFIICATPFYKAVSYPLDRMLGEYRKEKAEAIVIAGAGVLENGAPTIGSAIRAHAGGLLYLEGMAPLVLITGGVTHPYNEFVETKGMHLVLRGMGVPDKDVLIENKSVDTYTNGVHSSEILKRLGIKKIILVSHDYHLPRLRAVFDKLGFETIPHVANHESRLQQEWWSMLDWKNINRLKTVFHEYIGLMVYKIQDRI